jgi:hypothetical protein
MRETAPLKYNCLDGLGDKIKSCSDDKIARLLTEMYDLIIYQMNQIKEQRIEIIGLKHKEAWKRYDLPESSFKPCVDKPSKSDNISC